MKLISLKGRNIGLLKGDFEFNFDDALTVITGPIGCGKSTLLTMVRASLTNSFPGNASSWASWGIPPQEACYFVATWRIGDKVLHIAKCVAGDKQFATLNIPRLRIEKDSGEVEEITSSREALEKTLSLIPVPASIIDGHLIVDQDSITAPVSSTPAKFKEIIHTLTRTNELENMRSGIRDVLATVTVPDIEDQVVQAKADVNVDHGEVFRLEQQLKDFIKASDEIGIKEVNKRLDELELIKRQNDRKTQIKSELVGINSQITQLTVNLKSVQTRLVDIENRIATLAPTIEDSRKAVYSSDALLKESARKKALIQQQVECFEKLDALQASSPVKPDFDNPTDQEIEQSINASNEAWQELTTTEKKIKLAEKGQCPECGNTTAVCEADLVKLNNRAAECRKIKEEFDTIIIVLRSQKSAWNNYEIAAKKWVDSVQVVTDKCEGISADLESMHNTADVDEAVIKAHSKAVEEYELNLKQKNTLENQISTISTHKANQESTLQAKTEELENLSSEEFDANEHARLTKLVDDHLQLRMKISQTQGAIENSVKALERSKSRLKVLLDRAAQIKPIQQFRKILERAAAALVKDGLPKLLSLQYMGKLNERLAFYLTTINADFTAFIDDSLEFTARKADGLTHRANRLSGGQKQQASVAYLLAVNDVFASTLGILALDEPSGAMQESNSQELAEAFSYLAKVGKQTGRQFIVITHSAALAAYGCTHIELEGR
jgi:DNA repair exonuclease SbcCD ATPase subunit